MNKNRYRIIFNKARGMMMAVAETANSHSSNPSNSKGMQGDGLSDQLVAGMGPESSDTVQTAPRGQFQLQALTALLLANTLILPNLAQAQIFADASAPANQRPDIGVTNGIPRIDIQTPNARGVSYNRYTQMDVSSDGVVINNSRQGANSRLAGQIPANSRLGAGEASTIINEVRSTAPTQFAGNLEVVRSSHSDPLPNLIIANPSGINVEGAGFIGVNRATLTTGTPTFNTAGDLTGFSIKKGAIQVNAGANGQGLGGANNQANFTDILARAVLVNANINSNNSLDVVTGPNNVSANLDSVTTQAGDKVTAPAAWLDVAALGGMYANSINLIGTEGGLGFRNAGMVSSNANLIVTSAGRVENIGTLQSINTNDGVLSITTTDQRPTASFGDIINTGTIAANKLLLIDAGRDLHNRKTIQQTKTDSTAPIILNAGRDINLNTSGLIDNKGTGAVSLATGQNINVHTASIVSRGDVYIDAGQNVTLHNNNSKFLAGQDVSVIAGGSISSTNGVLSAQAGNLHLEASQPLNIGTTTASTSSINLNGGTLIAGKALNLVADHNLTLNPATLTTGSLNTLVGNDMSYQVNTDVNTQNSISLVAGNLLEVLGNENTITSQLGSIEFKGGEIRLHPVSLRTNAQNQSIQITADKSALQIGNKEDGTYLNSQGDIKIQSLLGDINLAHTKATSTKGTVSILGHGNVKFESKVAQDGEGDYIAISLDGHQGVNLGSIGTGSFNFNAMDLTSTYGDIQLLAGQNLGNVNFNPRDIVTASGNQNYLAADSRRAKSRTSSSSFNARNISIKADKGDLFLDQMTMNATQGNLEIQAGQFLDLRDTTSTSARNTSIASGRGGILTLNNLNATAKGHMAISSNGQLYMNSLRETRFDSAGNILRDANGNIRYFANFSPSSTNTLNADGLLSIHSSYWQNHKNSNYTGGAINVSSGQGIHLVDAVNWNAKGSSLLANDTGFLKDGITRVNTINGDLSIEARGSSLTLTPSMNFRAVGDIDIWARDLLTLKGNGGNQGNATAQVLKLNAGKSLNLTGGAIDIQAAKLSAVGDVNINAVVTDVYIQGLRNKFTGYSSLERVNQLGNEIAAIDREISATQNQPLYQQQKAAFDAKQHQLNFIKNDMSRIEYLSYGDNFSYVDRHGNVYYQDYNDGSPEGTYSYYDDERRVSAPAGLLILPDYHMLDVLRNEAAGIQQELDRLSFEMRDANNLLQEHAQSRETIVKGQNLLRGLGNGFEHLGADIDAVTGSINILAKGGISIEAADLYANNTVNIRSADLLTNKLEVRAFDSDGNRITKEKTVGIQISGLVDGFEYNVNTPNYSYARFNRPTNIVGRAGINITASHPDALNITPTNTETNPLANVGKDRGLVISASNLTTLNPTGAINIRALGDIDLLHAQEDLYLSSQRTYKTGKWYNRKTVTETRQFRNSSADPVELKTNNINIQSGRDILAEATVFDGNLAGGGKLNINATGSLRFDAVGEIEFNQVNIVKKRSWFSTLLTSAFTGFVVGLAQTRKETSSSSVLVESELPSRLISPRISTTSGGNTILRGTQFAYLEGADLRAGFGPEAQADAKIVFEAIRNKVTSTQTRESSSVVWQTKVDAGTITETATLPKLTGPVAPSFNAPGGFVVNIPNGLTVKTYVDDLAKDPGFDYLQQLVVAKNVDWQTIELVNKEWNEKTEGLTAAGAALLSLAVAFATGGAGSAVSGWVTGATGSATVGTAASGAFMALTSQAAVLLVNNKGDIGKTLKDLESSETGKMLLTAALTAGLTAKVGKTLGFQGQPNDFLGMNGHLVRNVTNSTVSALANVAVNGGDLRDSLEKALLAGLVTASHASVSNQIKGLEGQYILHKIAHAAAGCAAAAAQRQACEAGAIGAAVGEIVAEMMPPTDTNLSPEDYEKGQADIRNVSKIVAGAVAAYTGHDVNTAATIAETAVKNNRQLNTQEVERIKKLANGDKQKEQRLHTAACALIRCSAHIPEGTPEYALAKAMEDIGNSAAYQAERALLSTQRLPSVNPRQTEGHQLFQPSPDWLEDFRQLDTKYQIGTRAGGLLMVAGGVTAGAASTAGLVSCPTVAGCALATAGAITSADLAAAGVSTLLYGKPQSTLGATAISLTTGIPIDIAEALYGTLNLAASVRTIQTGLAQAQQTGATTVRTATPVNFSTKSCSFRGDMQVKTMHGYRAIQDINPQDYVYTLNELTGSASFQKVLAHYSNNYESTVYIGVKDQHGNQQTIVSNKIHPFFTIAKTGTPPSSEGHSYKGHIQNGQWVDAANLTAGDQLLGSNNQWQQIVSVTIKPEPLKAFNLTVDQTHTYFIKGVEAGEGVWVHNTCSLADLSKIPKENGTATAVKKPNGSTEVVYTNPNGNILKWNIQSEKDIQQNISSAAASAERGKQAEAIVARIAQEQGVKVEGFGIKVTTVNGNQTAGDADIVTAKYLIEVKRTDNVVSSDQFAKYVDPRATNFFNPSNKQVVLYVHEGGLGSKTASVQGRYGDKVKVVYGPDQLRAFLGGQ